MMDGNEYLKRGKCALLKEKVKLSKDLREVYKWCPNSPINGGKDQKPSKFCVVHRSFTETGVPEPVHVPPEFETAEKELAGLLPEEKASEEGCKKK